MVRPRRVDCVDPDRSPQELEGLGRELSRHGAQLRCLAEHYALLAGETRLRILTLLKSSGELCVCDLATILKMTPAAVSQHLSRLRAGELVLSRRDGMAIYYRLSAVAREACSVVPALVPPGAGDKRASASRDGRGRG